MAGWNIADVLEIVAEEVPQNPALIAGSRIITWSELDSRAARIGRYLFEQGLPRQANIALYLRNRSEYVESLVACMKASFVPFNTNFRYVGTELEYLWNDANAAAVIFQGEFVPVVEDLRSLMPEVAVWLWVDDGTGVCPEWAVSYEAVATTDVVDTRAWDRSPDDLVILYTGGTTGMPKGVMWRQDDLFVILGNATGGRYGEVQDLEYARSRVADPGRRHIPAAPLMHGTGSFTCLPFLWRGGAIVMLEGESFRADELLDCIERNEVNSVAWVGDIFARPVVEALDAGLGRWSLDSWRTVTSGGLAFSAEMKERLLSHVPQLTIADVYGASETLAVGRSVTRTGEEADDDRTFRITSEVRVLREDGTQIEPNSHERGFLAFGGRKPVGYFNDPDSSAQSFKVLDGRRFTLTGDLAEVLPDGRILLVGRGSTSINTGGEKVFPEEVEETILRLDGVRDVAVAGVADARFGQAVGAVVAADGLTEDDIVRHVREHLARYKSPRKVVFVEKVPRLDSGKPDTGRLGKLLGPSVSDEGQRSDGHEAIVG